MLRTRRASVPLVLMINGWAVVVPRNVVVESMLLLPSNDQPVVFGNTHDNVPVPFVVRTDPSVPAVKGITREYPVVADGGVIDISFPVVVCSRSVCVVIGTASPCPCACTAHTLAMTSMASVRMVRYVQVR